MANDSLPPPIGGTSDDKQSPSKARKTTPISEPIKLTLVVLGLALILAVLGLAFISIALPTAQHAAESHFNLAAVITAGAGSIFLVLSTFLLRVRRHWAHLLMLLGSIGIMGPALLFFMLQGTLQGTLEGTAAGFFFRLFLGMFFMLCVPVILGASGVCCFVSALVVLFVKTDSTGTFQERLPQRVALVGGSLIGVALLFLVPFVTGRPALLVHEIYADTVTITGCQKEVSGHLVIPQDIEDRPVTRIGAKAFEKCYSLTEVTIPAGVTSIGAGAFYFCHDLATITIPDGVTSIGNQTYSMCLKLTSVTIPDSVTSIGENAFWNCKILTSITIPDSVISIGEGAFKDCSSLTSITVPDGVTSIGLSAFGGCKSLTSITIPDGVTSIGDVAFYNCRSLTGITIPDSVTSIGVNAFRQCGLTSITIPSGMREIKAKAFKLCTSLTAITIPEGVSSIGIAAFYHCRSLTAVTFLGDAPKVAENAFEEASPTIYRKPEAKGWGDTFAGRPVKLISEKP